MRSHLFSEDAESPLSGNLRWKNSAEEGGIWDSAVVDREELRVMALKM